MRQEVFGCSSQWNGFHYSISAESSISVFCSLSPWLQNCGHLTELAGECWYKAWRALSWSSGDPDKASALLLTSLLTLGPNVWVFSPFYSLGPSPLLQINHYSFCPFPGGITFWSALGFLDGAMMNHVAITVAKNLFIISANRNKLNRLLAFSMGALVMNRVKKHNLELRMKGPRSVAVQDKRAYWRKEGIFLYFLNLFFWNDVSCHSG